MSVPSKRIQRLEKEAILRAKEYGYSREKSEDFLSNLHRNWTDDDDKMDRHRREVTTRKIRQIQREAEYPLEMLDTFNEGKYQTIRRQNLAASTQKYSTSLSSSSLGDRANRDNGITEKYTSHKRPSTDKRY